MSLRARTRAIVLGLTAVVAAIVLLDGVSDAAGGGPILANPPAPRPSVAPRTPTPTSPVADPQPVVFPRDDGPHDRLTEWWYYTGHLESPRDNGTVRRLGFEYVIFRAERGTFPTTWASHLAITDEQDQRLIYSQRLEVGPQVDRSPRREDGTPAAFDLSLSGIDPTDPGTFDRPAWTMTGADGIDHLRAALSPAEAEAAGVPRGLSMTLSLSTLKPPALHDTDGWIDFGPAGSSYYYSRTRMEAAGAIVLEGETMPVRGLGWFDHQWGDFISVGGGGWDWFAVNLEDGTDLTLSLVRDADGTYPLIYGTLVDGEGVTAHLPREAFIVEVTDRWTSPTTGADYPAGWRITVPGEQLVIELEPTVADQELDTRATTGVVYWEGSQRVTATRAGETIGGEAYVELTGYAASTGADAGPSAGPSAGPGTSPSASP